ncbi:MAG: UDP-3-O-(3-hydroxymyristoyl)glucosamine N-acyltransferase [Gammaproteobacteria bacterium]|nr:UDP-3-O-(3-hydroxymyristoyl)glucosamine N-acyltransferase [Gammaproteobacteria bacterium]
MARRLADLVTEFGGVLRGDGSTPIAGIATLNQAGGAELSFLANTHYHRYLKHTRAAAVLLREQDAAECPVTAWVVQDPYAVFARVAQCLYPAAPFTAGIHPRAVVEPGASIDATAYVGANCYLGSEVNIGPGVYIGPGCTLSGRITVARDSRLAASVTLVGTVQVGARCLIHPGCVFGADGFGFAPDHGEWLKIPQIGAVIIGNDVEVGANTTIDRGALEDTVIHDGVKLDNQIQIGHNVQIGAHTAIAACTAVAGSTRIGARCAIGGCVGIVGHLEISDDVQITGMSMVTHSIRHPGVYSSGIPVEENAKWKRNAARYRQLDDLADRVRRLETAGTDKLHNK